MDGPADSDASASSEASASSDVGASSDVSASSEASARSDERVAGVPVGREHHATSVCADAAAGPIATPQVRVEWARRVEAEYTSSAHTAEVSLWLIRLGAPRELIDDALRIVSDELDHAELSAAVCRAAGEEARPTLSQERLALAVGGADLSERCLRACIEVFCLGETVAVPLFVELRRACRVEAARLALDRIVRDEVRHRQFGWDLLEFLFDWRPELRSAAGAFLPVALRKIEARYGRAQGPDVSDAERAWGLMSPRLYREIFEQTVEKEYRPRFAELGLSSVC